MPARPLEREERVKRHDLHPCGAQLVDEGRRGVQRTVAVVDEMDLHAFSLFAQQVFGKEAAHRIRAGQKIKVPPLSEERLVLPTSEGFYKIRLGTFSRREYANRYENEAALRGKQIRLAPNRVLPGKTWYRATAGKFTSREQGLRAVRALRQRGLLPYFASPSPKKGGR